MSSSEGDRLLERKIWERQIAGEYNTFLVYLFLLRARQATCRETQRVLGFSSPSLAAHHLDKLEKLGLAVQGDRGNYNVVPRSFGILRFFFVVGRWIVPRSVFLASIFATMTIGFLIHSFGDNRFLPFLALSAIGLLYSTYQTAMFYRLLPEKR